MTEKTDVEKIEKVLSLEQLIEQGKREGYAVYWFKERLAEKYHIISPEIFELKRKVRIKNEYDSGRTVDIDIPSIFSVKIALGQENPKDTSYNCRDKFYDYKLKIEVPEFNRVARRALIDSLIYCSALVDAAQKDHVLKRILESNPEISLPTESEYKMIWAPEEIAKITVVITLIIAMIKITCQMMTSD
jgi:hypothetical protein